MWIHENAIKRLLRVLSHVQGAPDEVKNERHVFNVYTRRPSLRKLYLMRPSVVNLTIERATTGLRTIERETVINELDLSKLNNFFDQEEAAVFETKFYDDSFFLSNATLLKLAKRFTIMDATCLLEEMENRRRLFVDVKEQSCPFSTGIMNATKIPLSVLVLAFVAWSLSLILYVASLYYRNLTFDISNSLHWAKYARHDMDDMTSTGPLLRALDGDEKCVRVYGYVHDDMELGIVRDAIKLSKRWVTGFIEWRGRGREKRIGEDVVAGDESKA